MLQEVDGRELRMGPRQECGEPAEARHFICGSAGRIDPGRVIARDVAHSRSEPRFDCLGRVSDGVLTVRFTYRANIIRIIGAGYWRRGKKLHEAHSRYTNEPLGRVEVVEDFLPPPDQLVLREFGVKVTISLSKKSVDFFKAHAAQSKVPYQRVILTFYPPDPKHEFYFPKSRTRAPSNGERTQFLSRRVAELLKLSLIHI